MEVVIMAVEGRAITDEERWGGDISSPCPAVVVVAEVAPIGGLDGREREGSALGELKEGGG